MFMFLDQPPAGVWNETMTWAMWSASGEAYQEGSRSSGIMLRPSLGISGMVARPLRSAASAARSAARCWPERSR